MNPLSLISDNYERKARLYPALLVLAPVLMLVVAIRPGAQSVFQPLVAVVASCGGIILLAQLTRDAGIKREKALYEEWGGMPSVAIFRHRDTRLDPITKARYHKHMAVLIKEATAPSTADEQANAAAADAVYAAWSTYLRTHTRNTQKFPLVFRELVNYGFRRNLTGMRRTGILASASSFGLGAGVLLLRFRAAGTISETVGAATSLALCFLFLWVFRFSSDWVRIPADAYAKRLVETADAVSVAIEAK